MPLTSTPRHNGETFLICEENIGSIHSHSSVYYFTLEERTLEHNMTAPLP